MITFAPLSSALVTLSGGGFSTAWGPWVEVIASAPSGAALSNFLFNSASTGERDFQIGVGGSGSEVPIGSFRVHHTNSAASHFYQNLPTPIAIPTGARVSMRMFGLGSDTVGINYYTGYTGVTTNYVANVLPAASGVGQVSSLVLTGDDSVAWNPGPWAEITSGFARNIGIYGVAARFPSAMSVQYDLATGPDKDVIASVRNYHPFFDNGRSEMQLPAVFPVPAGTSIWIRVAKSVTTTGTHRATLLFYDDIDLNAAPIVDAGPDQAFTWPQNVTNLAGSASDADGTIVGTLWTKLSGPGTAIFGNAAALLTTALFSEPGVYEIQLEATDDQGATGTDVLTITIAHPTAEIEFPEAPSGDTIGLTWREFYHVDAAGDDDVDLAAPVDLNDPTFYYGGYKQGRVLAWMEIVRALSDTRGQPETSETSWVESDTDRKYRGWLGNAFQKYIQNRQVILRMIDDASRRLFVTPRTLLRAIVRRFKALPGLRFQFWAEDFMSSLFGPANYEKQIPQEAITRAQFASCPTTALGLPVPILFGDLSNTISATAPPTLIVTAARGGYDDGGGHLVAGFGDLTSLAAIPTTPGIVAGAGGSGTLGTLLDYYNAEVGAMVTAVDVNGVETDPVPFYSDGPHGGSRGSFANGFPLPSVVIDGTQKVTVTWAAAAAAAKYRIYIGYYYYGFRPQLMKEVTAPTLTVDFTSDTDGTPGSFAQFWWYAVSAVMPDGETGLSQVIFGIVRTHRREIRIEWNAIVGATAYRIYRRGVTSDWDRKWEVAAPTTTFDDDLLDTGATFITGLAELSGVVPATYIGIEFDTDGNPWQAGLVCGHQVEEISKAFQHGVAIDTAMIGANLLLPGHANYDTFFTVAMGHTGTPEFHTVNGRIYTKIYTRGAIGEAFADGTGPISLNVKGRRDSLGTFISQLADIYFDFVKNFGFQDAAGGHLPPPQWAVDVQGDTASQIDEASFADLKAIHAARLVGGYPGGIAFGADGTFVTLRDAIARLNQSNGCDSFFDRNSRFAVAIFNEDLAVLTAARSYTQLHDIVTETFDQDALVDEVENIVVYSYRRLYVQVQGRGEWDIEDAELPDATASGNLREVKRSEVLELWGVRTANVAIDLATRRLVEFKEPRVPVTLLTNLRGLSTELGDVILVSHIEGSGSNGWTLRPVRVHRHITNPQKYTVRLECIDVQRIYDHYNP